MSKKKEEKKPSEDKLAKQAIAKKYKKEFNATPIIIRAGFKENKFGYATITKDHIQLFEYDKNIDDVISLANHQISDYENVVIDHYAIKSILQFKGLSKNFELIAKEEGKKIESFIQNNTDIGIQKVHRKFRNKILGFRSNTKWKMIVASAIYLFITVAVVSGIIDKKENKVASSTPKQEIKTENKSDKDFKTLVAESDEKEAKQKASKPSSTTSGSTTPSTSNTPKMEVSEEAKKIALETISQNPHVRDAHIEIRGNKIIMAVIVDAAVNKNTAKEIGDNFVRNLGAFAGGKAPEKHYYGEIFDNYDLQIGVGTSPDNIVVQGAKVASGKNIMW
ncbi:hypothetical protein P4W10_16085 [Bacillus thuringiensis]|uniref:hypothetical protein n=1 Tax=Bacillus thuringiensis TaxID=1428 RepID=UPI002DBBFE0C|nr:hypothetical protein [Bacillus thuringiensis]MEC3228186.1 hypothetical protein [Bacillus thuringiensis]MEC3484726.1 hypothetical protein [Bacillus thuringiensis]MED2067891.1 hypothetical protein [Bacillus thuringiensis]MED2191760.1 hypothetical protein [Bacillus thuringiensis]MED2213158.1 hypothetical protein [Bacillus thuringiensis]